MLCQLNRLTDRRERAWSEIDRNENVPDGVETPFEQSCSIFVSEAVGVFRTLEMCRSSHGYRWRALHSHQFWLLGASDIAKASAVGISLRDVFPVINQNGTGSSMLEVKCLVQIEQVSEKGRMMAGGYQQVGLH